MSLTEFNILIATGDATFNSGDEVIFSSVLHMVRRDFPGAMISTFSEQPEKTSARYNVRAVRLGTTLRRIISDTPALLREVAHCDVMIWGGGNLIQDASSVIYTPYHMSKVIVAAAFRKPVFAYAIGVGPIKRHLTRTLIRTIGQWVDHYTVRDALCREVLTENGIAGGRIDVVADPALALESDDKAPNWKVCFGDGDPPSEFPGWIGLAPMNVFVRTSGLLPVRLKVSLCGPKSTLFRKQKAWEQVIANWADHVAKEYGLGIILIPMYCAKGIRDDLICQNIQQVMHHPNHVRILKPDLQVSELLRVYQFLSMVVGVRYHSLLLSLATGRPFLALNYTQKSFALTKRLGYDNWSLHAERISSLDLIRLFDHAWRKKEELTQFVQEKAAVLRVLARNTENIFRDFVASQVPRQYSGTQRRLLILARNKDQDAANTTANTPGS